MVDRVTLSNVISDRMNKNAKFPNLASEHWEPKEERENQAVDRSRGGERLADGKSLAAASVNAAVRRQP